MSDCYKLSNSFAISSALTFYYSNEGDFASNLTYLIRNFINLRPSLLVGRCLPVLTFA